MPGEPIITIVGNLTATSLGDTQPISPLTLQAINAEVVRAITKHGLAHSPINSDTPPGECLAMLVEEVGEVAHTLTYDADPDALDCELIQVAAVAAMWFQARTRPQHAALQERGAA